jgi:serine/threonine protein phosphatase PrpC
MRTTVEWRSAAASDTGLQRSNNEDRVYADESSGVFIVVDGVGGQPAGEKAADTALETIVRELDPSRGQVERQIRNAVTAANNEIWRLSQTNPDWSGMACVLTLAVAHEDMVTVGHVGDSRLYLLWNGTIRKLTPDHSPVGEQEDSGELTMEEAMAHPRRHEVFRDVGSRERHPDDDDFIEVRSFPFHPAAAFLLCSDGLSDVLTSIQIGDVVEEYNGDPAQVAHRLVEAANQHGGTDNVSVVFVAGPDFVGTRSPAFLDARARHATTRARVGRRRVRFSWGRLIWLLLGIILGMAIWAAAGDAILRRHW